MKLQIHIERLVLEGLPLGSHDKLPVQGEVQAELTRLLTEAGLAHELQTGGAIPRLQAAGIAMTRRDKPAELGRRIAGAIHSAIGTAPPSREDRAGRPRLAKPHAGGPKRMSK